MNKFSILVAAAALALTATPALAKKQLVIVVKGLDAKTRVVAVQSAQAAASYESWKQGKIVEQGRASKLLAFRGLERVPVEEAYAGDIISIAGMTDATVGFGAVETDVRSGERSGAARLRR